MLTVGSSHTLNYTVPAHKGVPNLFPETEIFTSMLPVFATGFLIGLMEWACLEHLQAATHHGEDEITLGLGVNITHEAPCTEGAELVVKCVCTHVGTRSQTWQVEVHCQNILIGQGTHKRVIVNKAQFLAHVNQQAQQMGSKTVEWPQ